MTRTGGEAGAAVDGQSPSTLTGAHAPTADATVAGVAVADAADVRVLRRYLAELILPGATDTPAGVSKDVQAQWVDLLGELEAVKNTVAATQARLAVALEEATKADEARAGIGAARRGRGVPNQVGAAMQSSPHAGSTFLGTARVWVTGMPHTFNALRTGVLSQWRATLLVRETSHLSPEHRALIDEEICGPAHLAELARLGTRRLVARIKELAGRLDVHACVKRNAKATTERCVSVRPAPDLMVYLTALVPMQQGVQAYAQLKAHAEAVKAMGDERGAGNIMADTLIERVTGRETGAAGEVPVTISLLVSDQTLLAGGGEHEQSGSGQAGSGPGNGQADRGQAGSGMPGTSQVGGGQLVDEPAVVLEGAPAGVGTVPGPVARNLVAHAIDTDAAWLRAIYVNPQGRLLATTSTSRFHPQGLAALLRAREQGICATTWCDAPIRHLDHVTPHAEGGPTSLDNGQGLCARCNHAKQAPGWTQKTTQIDGRHAVETVTPTGHTTVCVAPTPPEPVRTPGSVRTPDNTVRTSASARALTSVSELDPVRGTGPASEPDPARNTGLASEPDPASETGPAGREDRDRSRQPAPAPAWTPAVGMPGPGPGRIPRSRYSIGCHTGPDRGAIAYRPPRNTGPGRRRIPKRRRPADLVWAHTG